MARSGYRVLIVTIYSGGEFWDEASAIPGVRLESLGRRNGAALVWRLRQVLRRERIDVLCAFLSTAQLYAMLTKIVTPRVRLIFRIGDSLGPTDRLSGKIATINVLLRMLSSRLSACLVNSEAAAAVNVFRVPRARLSVVHNGIDTVRFHPDAQARAESRALIGAGDGVPLVGCVGSFSAYKDHATLIRAAALVLEKRPRVMFVTIGDHETPEGAAARDQAARAGIAHAFRFLGRRRDVERLLPACDLGVSSSATEGFQNAVCEFMAAGVPCVVTNVGDAAAIVGSTGRVVPRRDPAALAAAMLELLALGDAARRELGDGARARIVEQFSVSAMVAKTMAVVGATLDLEESAACAASPGT